jgi:hypothetical protein
MSTPIRYRTDSISAAEAARDRAAGKAPSDWDVENEEEIARTPPVAAGDCWRIVYGATEDGKPESTAGYAIACPKCPHIHYWTSANNCTSKRQTATGGWSCDHQEARTSCWTWTVDESGKPVQAVASLFVNHAGGCGYHGHLTDGALTNG